MKIEVLGCSGGIGGPRRTTAFLVDDDILIDCGTGVGELSLQGMATINHIFLTHAHFDHIACLPMLSDSSLHARLNPLRVYAGIESLNVLREHVFNWKLWPDITQPLDAGSAMLEFLPVDVGQTVKIGTRNIQALPAKHTVPANGYLLDSGQAALALTGDTQYCSAFWEALAKVPHLRTVVVECSFPDEESALARKSGHFHPAALADALLGLREEVDIYITHLKPGVAETTMAQVREHCAGRSVYRLEQDACFEI